ncbi:MAG TPA: RDD family protein [Candidatus Angelobacter sp.]
MAQERVFCSRCGESNLAGGAFCQRCGASLGAIATPVPVPPGMPVVPVVLIASPYGGFWIRVLAYLIDRIVVGAIYSPIAIYFALRMVAELRRLPPNGPEQLGPIFHFVSIVVPLAFVVQWLYEALLTSSSWQATVGKRVLDLKVTDEGGNPISFERATARFFAKVLSSLALGIGFLMVAFTARKQGLHDLLAGTLVMKT